MKRQLLFAMLSIVSVLGIKAQEDVTSTYLSNADFSSGTPIDNNVCTYGKDMESNGTTYYGPQAIDSWTNASVGTTADGYDNCGLAGALFEYGSTPWLAGTGTPAPATDSEGNAGNAAGLCAVWGGSIQYTQAVTLPAGSYTVRFKVYNATSGNGNSSGVITTDLFGFVEDGGITHYAPNNTFAIGQWSTIAVTFNLTEETAGKISMGYVGPSGNAAMPHLFVDQVQILKNEMFEDCTNKVNATGWTNASDGYQGGDINTAREYGNKAVGRHIYQTVSGLDNGTYEVAVYSTSQKEWNGSLANDAGDVAYVFAEGAYELKEWMNARSRAGYPGDENMGIYTISGVMVTDGTLTIGMGLDKENLTEWHHMQIKSLIHTNNPDLSDFIEAYETALAAAKAFDQNQKMASSIKDALNDAIDTYDEGKVDETNQTDLETAADALRMAVAKANKSVASYTIIATGTIPDNSLEGWTCTNTNEFVINTWSTEGGPNHSGATRDSYDPTGMVEPFIQNWVGKGSYLGAGTISYTLEGLEPGEVYYAEALVRSYNEANSDAPNGPDFFINDAVTNLSQDGTTFTYSGMSGIYATLSGAATVGEDGKLTLGVKIEEDRNYNWVAFKNVKIQSFDDALAAKVAEAEALVTGETLPSTVAANLQVVIENNDNDPEEFDSAEDYLTAINAIDQAMAEAKAFEPSYAAWLEMKEKADELVAVANDNTEANTTFGGDIETQEQNVDEAETTAAIEEATAALKTAMTTYAFAANPKGEGAQFDLTFLLTNPDLTNFASWTGMDNVDGWSSDQTDGNRQVMHNNDVASENGDAFFEYWSEEAKANGLFALYTTVSLPEGTFLIQCDALASANNVSGATTSKVYFYANETQGSLIDSPVLSPASIEFVNNEEQDVNIGLKPLEGNQFRWMGIGYVQLFKVPAKAFEIDEAVAYDNTQEGAGDVKLTRTIKEGMNTVVLPFQMTAADIEILGGEGAVARTVSEYLPASEDFSFAEVTEVSANQQFFIYATVASADREDGNVFTFKGKTLVAGDPEAKVDDLFTLVGTYAVTAEVPVSTPEKRNFILNGGKFYNVDSEGVSIHNTRCYIEINIPNIAINEGETFENTQTYKYANVTLTRTIKEGMNTVVVPFELTAEDIAAIGGEGAVAYTVSGYANDNLKFATAETVDANTPFFLNAKEATSDAGEFKFEGKKVVAGAPIVEVSEDCSLVGTYKKTDVPASDDNSSYYILSGGKFYTVDSEGVTIKNTRFYVATSAPAGANTLGFTFDGEANAINGIIANDNAPEGIYNLQGQKVEKATKGIYIINGKKVLVK